jgi:hypothetical protein
MKRRQIRILACCALAGVWTSGGAIGIWVAAGTVVACTTPPIGWEGAGRSQTLPPPMMDSGGGGGGGSGDSGSGDTGNGTLDVGFDAGEDPGVDAGCAFPQAPSNNCLSVCGGGSGCCELTVEDGGSFGCAALVGACCMPPS